ncbi:MAG: hypothetical protein QNL62_23365 [Gammaproteobacteria bacterium]|nr:hypothetical protein [Gammaproteobacteria bacterium]
MTVKKFANFMLRIYDQYVEISKSSHVDVTDVDMFEIWDYLEENFKLPIPVLTSHSKCYSVSSEAQFQLGDIVKKYYSAIAVINENNLATEPDDVDNDIFLEEVPIKFFQTKDEAIDWLKGYGPVEQL